MLYSIIFVVCWNCLAIILQTLSLWNVCRLINHVFPETSNYVRMNFIVKFEKAWNSPSDFMLINCEAARSLKEQIPYLSRIMLPLSNAKMLNSCRSIWLPILLWKLLCIVITTLQWRETLYKNNKCFFITIIYSEWKFHLKFCDFSHLYFPLNEYKIETCLR